MLNATFVELGNVELIEPEFRLVNFESIFSIFLLPKPSAIMKLIVSASYKEGDSSIDLFSTKKSSFNTALNIFLDKSKRFGSLIKSSNLLIEKSYK